MRYEAFAHQGFQEKGVTDVIVTRTDGAGGLQAGVFLVDLHCLGVKDAFATEMPAVDWPHELNKLIPAEDRVAIHPACARKLVEGAVAYAATLGFAPHRDYKKARRVFGSVNARDCPESFTYGRDRKPFYVAGPYDDAERTERVMRTLAAKLGPDGFHYLLPVGSNLADTPPREALREIFWERPPGKTSFEALGGFFVALHVCPAAIPADKFMPAVWANEPPRFRTTREQIEAPVLLRNYFDELRANLETAYEAAEPALAVDFNDGSLDEDDPELRERAADWCREFLRALREWPEAWAEAIARTDLQGNFAAIRAVATLPAKAKELASYVGAAVLGLHCALGRGRRG